MDRGSWWGYSPWGRRESDTTERLTLHSKWMQRGRPSPGADLWQKPAPPQGLSLSVLPPRLIYTLPNPSWQQGWELGPAGDRTGFREPEAHGGRTAGTGLGPQSRRGPSKEDPARLRPPLDAGAPETGDPQRRSPRYPAPPRESKIATSSPEPSRQARRRHAYGRERDASKRVRRKRKCPSAVQTSWVSWYIYLLVFICNHVIFFLFYNFIVIFFYINFTVFAWDLQKFCFSLTLHWIEYLGWFWATWYLYSIFLPALLYCFFQE